jgi:lia operon protein LiaF
MKGLSFGNFLIAAAFIFIGGWLLLSNMGLLNASLGSLLGVFLASVICIYGLWSIFKPLLRGRKPHWFIGIFGTAYGGLLLSGYYGYFPFHWGDFWKLWPLIFVYIGLEMLGGIRVSKTSDKKHYKEYMKNKYKDKYKDKYKEKYKYKTPPIPPEGFPPGDIPVPPKPPHFSGKGTSVFNIVKEYKFNEPNWPVEPLGLWSMVGDYEFDFTQAFIPDRETEIRLSGWIGDIDIIIPEEVAFMVKGEASITGVKIDGKEWDGSVGRKEINYKTPNFDEATRRLIFDADFKILDMRIDRV